MNNSHAIHLSANKNLKFFVKKKKRNRERLQCPGFRRLIEGKKAQCFPLLSRGVCMETYLCLSFKVKFDTINHLISESILITM